MSLQKCGGRSPLSTLYQCLMAPMEEAIAQQAECQEEPQDLVLVLQGDLYLIPFLMLRAEQAQRYLFERFNLIIVPSISALNNTEKVRVKGTEKDMTHICHLAHHKMTITLWTNQISF